uniref:MSL complex subunit 1 n=1 Tax=Amazona collaria TaxID=241587 RepID=A0A8B9F8Z4_9PSIT
MHPTAWLMHPTAWPTPMPASPHGCCPLPPTYPACGVPHGAAASRHAMCQETTGYGGKSCPTWCCRSPPAPEPAVGTHHGAGRWGGQIPGAPGTPCPTAKPPGGARTPGLRFAEWRVGLGCHRNEYVETLPPPPNSITWGLHPWGWAMPMGRSQWPFCAGHGAGSCLQIGGAHGVHPQPVLQLLARIERMERRVQLVKKDSEREKHRIFQGFEVDEKPEAEACEKLPLECPQDLLEPPPTLQPKHFPYGRNGKGHKRKPTFGSTERKTPVKKLVSEFSKVKSKTPKHSPGKEESGGSLSETVCKRELRSQETPEKPRSLLETPLRASSLPKGPGAHPKEKSFFSSEADDLPYLSTTEMYLCRWHQPP